MNPGIFYLYEYKNNQKQRNVGFLKIVRHYRSCTVQLHARGVPVTRQDTLKLSAFYMENETAYASVITEISCNTQTISARLNIAESTFPNHHTLNTIHGFILPLPDGRILAATAPDILLNTKHITYTKGKADTKNSLPESDILLPASESGSPIPASDSDSSIPASDSGSPIPASDSGSSIPASDSGSSIPASDSAVSEKCAPLEAESLNLCTIPAADTSTNTTAWKPLIGAVDPASREEPHRQNHSDIPAETGLRQTGSVPREESQPKSNTTPPEKAAPRRAKTTSRQTDAVPQQEKRIRKIRRSEMSVLPRRYWNLANNSFLLHGYNNYNHLLLVEEDGHYWLGIPGIYDTREARAAELFGFPQFTNSYNDKLSLSKEEYNDRGDFGYWCRFLR